MQWKRRKSVRPFLVALSCLFVLAILSPRSWQRSQSPLPARLKVAIDPALPVTASQPATKQADPDVRTTADDEYDEYLRGDFAVPTGAGRMVGSSIYPNVQWSVEESAEAVVSSQGLPSPPAFVIEQLLELRDAVSAFLNQTNQRPLDQPTQRVRVESSADRLAMLIDRDEETDSRHNAQLVDPVAPIATEAVSATDPTLQACDPPQVATVAPNHDVNATDPAESQTPPPAAALLQHQPKQLLSQLERIAGPPPAAAWAEQVQSRIVEVATATPADTQQAQQDIAQLRELAAKGLQGALTTTDPTEQYDWLLASQGLHRRVEIWSALFDDQLQSWSPPFVAMEQSESVVMQALENVAALIPGQAHASAWRDYLLLDRIAAASSEGARIDLQGRRKLALQVLTRMNDSRLTPQQSRFVATAPMVELQQAMQTWAAGQVNLHTLLAVVERYEMAGEVLYARAIAQLRQRMRFSGNERLEQLGEHFDRHYRSPNMRIAVSSELLSRMVPEQDTRVVPVSDKFAGVKIRGRSWTSTQLQVRTLPEENAWRLRLQAAGSVQTRTQSKTWPARVRNAGNMQFQGSKEIVISRDGLEVLPARARAEGRNVVTGVKSQFDLVPLFGSVVREMARQQHRKSRSLVLRQVKSKVAKQVRTQMDQGADPKLQRLQQRFRDNVLQPIEQLALVAEPVDMHTTEQRAVIRLRLANDGQLAAHTPRPSAPSDSLASLQLHESSLNNALAGLGLNGQRMTLGELFAKMSVKLRRPEAQPPEDLPTRAVVAFAAHDAIRIRCDGDRLELILNIRQLAHGRDKIGSFQVHAFFRPEVDGMQVHLVRDGTLQFSSRRLRTGPRVVLHSVFGKLLPKDQQIPMLAAHLSQDQRFAGLMVTQLVLENGWVAMAVGPSYPQRTAWRNAGSSAESESAVR